jgi:hypothetical protein
MTCKINNNSNLSWFCCFNKLPSIKSLSCFGFNETHDESANKINCLVKRISAESKFKLKPEDQKLLKECIRKHKEEFKNIPLNKLKIIFSDLLQEDITLAGHVEAVLDLFDKDNLLDMANLKENKATISIHSDALLKDKALESVLMTKFKAYAQEMAPEIISLGHHVIEIFISICGLNQIGPNNQDDGPWRHINSSYEAKAKYELYLGMFAYPTTLFSSIYAYVGIASVAAAGAGLSILATIVFAAIYMRFLRPCPLYGTGLETLTSRVLRQEEDPLYWRIDLLDKIQKALASRKGVILIGKPGEGKSATIRALAQYMVSDNCLDKNFKYKLLFQMTLSKQYGQSPFDTTYSEYKNYPNDAMFYIDEIQEVFKKDKLQGDKAQDDLKRFCNTFTYVLAATTTEEYEKHIKNTEAKDTILRRFTVIELEPSSDQEVEDSLYYALARKAAPDNLVDNGVIPYIVNKALQFKSDTAKIDAAHSLLSRALHALRSESSNELEKEILKMEQEYKILETKLWFERDEKDLSAYLKLKINLDEKKLELNNKKEKLKRIKTTEALFLKTKRSRYASAAKIHPTLEKNPSLMKQWLKKEVMTQILDQTIRNEKMNVGLQPALSAELIDKIIAQEPAKVI